MKLLKLKELANRIQALKSEGKRIVHCHGIFDILHIGHIRYLEQAKKMGDILIVTITPDRYVNRGPGRPVFNELLRSEMVASLHFADYVAINKWPTAVETIRLLKPDIYARGADFKNRPPDNSGNSRKEEEAIREVGGNLAYTDDVHFSSTDLINRYLNTISDEVEEYLSVFRQRYSKEQVLQTINNMVDLRVLVVGDTILDEYQYCEVIGKSSKDPVLALKYQSHDLFAGGVLAVANHVANFAKSVKLVTLIGEKDSHEDFIRSQLRSNIDPYFVTQDNAPTLIKRRFIEGYSLNKLFEVYVMDSSGLNTEKDNQLCMWVQEQAQNYDLVIAADFGHGAISENLVKTLADHSPFLAVNTQANAGNRGFHTISRYPRTDYACIAEHEIRLETRTINGDLKPMIEHIAQNLSCRQFVVTRGREGALVRNPTGDFIEVPSFAQNIVDRVGAGDAFFAVTSLAAAQLAPAEIIGFIGNAVGSLAVEIVGNKKSIDRQSTQKYISHLLR
ncbi:MAG: PfkB family carbohydrate kinase [Proteobacteria bacterium]|nr:PfkB family carbohydrate kinase [Pseudomonadota bacterium]